MHRETPISKCGQHEQPSLVQQRLKSEALGFGHVGHADAADRRVRQGPHRGRGPCGAGLGDSAFFPEHTNQE